MILYVLNTLQVATTSYRLWSAVLFLLMIGVASSISGQTDTTVSTGEHEKILLHSITGKWISVDSPFTSIEFVVEDEEVLIKPKVHVDYYRFRVENDSVHATGVAINWPPYDCKLNLIDSTTLEVLYIQYWKSIYRGLFKRE